MRDGFEKIETTEDAEDTEGIRFAFTIGSSFYD